MRTSTLVARTSALLESQSTIEEVVGHLRREGFSLAESIAALIRTAGMTPSEARSAVLESPTWADLGEGSDTPTAASRIHCEPIAPPDPPDQKALARLRESFRFMPRILEAWVRGERLTPDDGSPSSETSQIVLVLDPPVTGSSKQILDDIKSLTAELAATGWRREPDRGWAFSSTRFRPSRQRGAEKIYSRQPDPDS